MEKNKAHTSVMLNEVLEYLKPRDGGVYVDCTFGAGGYSKAILEAADCKVIGIDRDPSVKTFADELKKKFLDRFEFFNEKYSNLEKILTQLKIQFLDGIVLDIGVSSMQIDNAERGFSFQKDSRLDMRMGNAGLSAYDVVNTFNEKELADIIYNYGDEVKSRHIAKKIIENRPIETTFQLADIVRYFYKGNRGKIDPATKTFQAIRIFVNDELGELKKILAISKMVLKSEGRLIVVSFHSLEDGIVKNFLKEETEGIEKKDKYKKIERVCAFKLLTRKAVVPTEVEVKTNIRSRSAKLRAVEKC